MGQRRSIADWARASSFVPFSRVGRALLFDWLMMSFFRQSRYVSHEENRGLKSMSYDKRDKENAAGLRDPDARNNWLYKRRELAMTSVEKEIKAWT